MTEKASPNSGRDNPPPSTPSAPLAPGDAPLPERERRNRARPGASAGPTVKCPFRRQDCRRPGPAKRPGNTARPRNSPSRPVPEPPPGGGSPDDPDGPPAGRHLPGGAPQARQVEEVKMEKQGSPLLVVSQAAFHGIGGCRGCLATLIDAPPVVPRRSECIFEDASWKVLL